MEENSKSLARLSVQEYSSERSRAPGICNSPSTADLREISWLNVTLEQILR